MLDIRSPKKHAKHPPSTKDAKMPPSHPVLDPRNKRQTPAVPAGHVGTVFEFVKRSLS